MKRLVEPELLEIADVFDGLAASNQTCDAVLAILFAHLFAARRTA